MILLSLLLLNLFNITYSFIGSNIYSNLWLKSLLNLKQIQSTTNLNVAQLPDVLTIHEREEELRKWYLMNHNRRADSLYIVDDANTLLEAHAEAWKGVLVSLRVLEKDDSTREQLTLFEFPNINSDEQDLAQFIVQMETLSQNLNRSACIFQPNYMRELSILEKQSINIETGNSQTSFILAIDTYKTGSKQLSIKEDFLDPEYVPDVTDLSDLVTNDIPGFPFPSVFDFISEINRPPDPLTLSNLGFNYKMTDLKYDLEKMKKKRNPQEVVDSINCKLTRLQFWKNILEKEGEALPDPFIESSGWTESIQKKYQSLVSLKKDPSKILETQYDKREVFIKIIEEWSDRLKRSFKFYYQPQTSPEDFLAPIMRSKWQNEILNTSKIFSQVTFLDLQGPDFTPGSPAPLFDDKRYILWGQDYAAELAMYEMLAWLRQTRLSSSFESDDTTSDSTSIDNTDAIFNPIFGRIIQHTYSRGFVSERVAYDTWQGLARFLRTIETSSGVSDVSDNNSIIDNNNKESGEIKYAPLDAKKVAKELSSRSEKLDIRANNAEDHTEEFLLTLRKINKATRNRALEEGKSVKQMYKQFHRSGVQMVEWWTTLVRDMDLIEKVHNMGNRREDKPWSDLMNQLINEELDPELAGVGDTDVENFLKESERHTQSWENDYRDIMITAEKLESLLPWKSIRSEDYNEEALDIVKNLAAFDQETVHVDFIEDEGAEKGSKSMLLVAPRYFRGIGLNEELSAFLEYSRVVSSEAKTMLNRRGIDLTVIPLHPQMINQNGNPDFQRQAPHPALIFKIHM